MFGMMMVTHTTITLYPSHCVLVGNQDCLCIRKLYPICKNTRYELGAVMKVLRLPYTYIRERASKYA